MEELLIHHYTDTRISYAGKTITVNRKEQDEAKDLLAYWRERFQQSGILLTPIAAQDNEIAIDGDEYDLASIGSFTARLKKAMKIFPMKVKAVNFWPSRSLRKYHFFVTLADKVDPMLKALIAVYMGSDPVHAYLTVRARLLLEQVNTDILFKPNNVWLGHFKEGIACFDCTDQGNHASARFGCPCQVGRGGGGEGPAQGPVS